jgi:hypothetical protein
MVRDNQTELLALTQSDSQGIFSSGIELSHSAAMLKRLESPE